MAKIIPFKKPTKKKKKADSKRKDSAQAKGRAADEMKYAFQQLLDQMVQNGQIKGGEDLLMGVLESPNAIQLLETPREIQLRMKVNGVQKDDIKASIQDNSIHIQIDKEDPHRTIVNPRRSRSKDASNVFSQSIPLPRPVDEGMVRAKLRNGVLSISCAKKETQSGPSVDIPIEEENGDS